jgi:exopolysaccharide biosynthesis operon protein EpsL
LLSAIFLEDRICLVLNKTTSLARSARLVACALALGVAITPVLAAPESDAVELNAGISLVRDSNLFRLPKSALLQDGTSRADTLRQLSVGGKAGFQASLQRFSLEAAVLDNHYQSNSYLDNTSYNALGRWDWQVGERVAGNLKYNYRRSLADFGDRQRESRDLLTERSPSLNVNWRIGNEYLLGGELSRQDLRHSDPSQSLLDNQLDSAALTFAFTTGSTNSIGAQIRQTNSKYRLPQTLAGQTFSNDYQQTDLGFVASWQLTGLTRVNGSVGYSSRKQDDFSSRDFSGITGRGSLEWSPTAKTVVRFGVGRQLASTNESSAAYVLVNDISVRPSWKVSDVLSLQAVAALEKGRFKGDSSFITSPDGQREDRVRRLRMQALYKPLKAAEFSFGLEAGSRSSNAAQRSYAYRQIEAGARFNY